ncbi:hypothetical protein BAHKABFF_00029 [Salmonella phage CF-SP1]|nr:hypothetical protein BAHKABFF_00029 [Salmonella phage CF-SP1]
MRKLTTEEFIIKAKAVHSDMYDYSKTIFNGSHSKLIINCQHHGYFEQIANNHLNGRGCKDCGIKTKIMKRMLSSSEFIAKSKCLHGNKYDYEITEYHGSNSIVRMTCKTHGEFKQRASDHLKGHGCQKCGKIALSEGQRSSIFYFIERACEIHGDKYDYSNVIYKHGKVKVAITCIEHGVFYQMPHAHLSGQGCPSCAKTGFDSNKCGYIYFLMSEYGIKVGITNTLQKRVNGLKSSTPFNFNLIHKIKTTGVEAQKIEKYFHKKYESAGLTGFDGATEWLNYSTELMKEIMK